MHSARQLLTIATLSLASFAGCSEPGVRGKVHVNGKPLAAGQIQFQPQEPGKEAFSAPVLHGNYDIRRSCIEGKYRVTVQVHFVETDKAAGFYREMTAEINSGKNLQGPEMLEPGENGYPKDTGSQQKQNGDTQPNHHHSQQFEFEEMLSGSVNIRDFHISR